MLTRVALVCLVARPPEVAPPALRRSSSARLQVHGRPAILPMRRVVAEKREKEDGRADDPRPMKIVSLNTGLPREVTWRDRSVTTAIYKQPVHGRVALRTHNLDGDRQADLGVHGGKNKAVYGYPLAHYDYWKTELPGRDLPMGIFGENFTLDGMREESVHIGDQFSIGSAEVIVTQPRFPCYKLGVRFDADDMVQRFLASGRTGFYFAVTREGEVGSGDELRLITRDSNAIAVSEITRLYATKRYGDANVARARAALRVAALPEGWKEYFRHRLEEIPTPD
jgi:MOSC domain-containing protein YiiM